MATKKLGTDVTKAFARASRRLPMTIKKLAPATRTRRQAARTMWTASKLLEAYRDPREVLLEIVSTDTATLAERNGCTPARGTWRAAPARPGRPALRRSKSFQCRSICDTLGPSI